MENTIEQANSHLAVRCRSVTKSYGTGDASVMALRGIDLEVRRGELLMIVGPSGCGKTTLISVIAGILDQDSGQCEVLGDKYNAEDRYVGSLVGVQYAEAFRSRSPLLVAGPEVFLKTRFG